MAQAQLQIEDLILFSRSLTIEEKQELLKKLDTYEPQKKTQIREVLEKEFETFKKLDAMELSAIQMFTQTLKPVTESITLS
mgnify:CR=1 FL=1